MDGRRLGFVGGYLKPSDPSVLFIWQIAVSREARGRRIGAGLLDEVLDRPACRHVRHLEATVTPSNEASRALFRSFARSRRVACREAPMFHSADFGGGAHEDEQLVRIGPFHAPGGGR